MDFRDGGVARVGGLDGTGGAGISRCLNQDLRDFDGFSGWRGRAGREGGWDEVVAGFSCCLNQDLRDFDGFSGWGSRGLVVWMGWEGLAFLVV